MILEHFYVFVRYSLYPHNLPSIHLFTFPSQTLSFSLSCSLASGWILLKGDFKRILKKISTGMTCRIQCNSC